MGVCCVCKLKLGIEEVKEFVLKMCQVRQVSLCEMQISLSLVKATNTFWREWRNSEAPWAAAAYVAGNKSLVQVEEPSLLIELFWPHEEDRILNLDGFDGLPPAEFLLSVAELLFILSHFIMSSLYVSS